jgi:hypothetical protein
MHLLGVHHFGHFAFPAQSKRFPPLVSNSAVRCPFWDSNLVVDFRFFVHMHSSVVSHFNQCAFLHQLKQFPGPVSYTATDFRLWHLNPIRNLQLLATGHLSIVRRSSRFGFRLAFARLPVWDWSVPESGQLLLIRRVDFSNHPARFWSIFTAVAWLGILSMSHT